MKSKVWWRSKTLWFNVVAAIGLLAQRFTGFVVDEQIQGAVLILVNVGLRIITKEEIVWFDSGPPKLPPRIGLSILFCVAVLGFSGCATHGRFSVVDVDLRTPEQIEAGTTEADVVLGKGDGVEEPVGVVPWAAVFDFLKVVKGRFRLFACEWSQ